MAAILDICKLANFQTQTGLSTKESSEKKSRKADEYWQQESIYVDLKYGNKSMAAILYMQISWFSNSARIIIRAYWEKILEDWINIEDWRVFTSDVNFEYAN